MEILYHAPDFPHTHYVITSTGFTFKTDKVAYAKPKQKEKDAGLNIDLDDIQFWCLRNVVNKKTPTEGGTVGVVKLVNQFFLAFAFELREI